MRYAFPRRQKRLRPSTFRRHTALEPLEPRCVPAILAPQARPGFEETESRGSWNFSEWQPNTNLNLWVQQNTGPFGTFRPAGPVFQFRTQWDTEMTIEPSDDSEKIGDLVEVTMRAEVVTSSPGLPPTDTPYQSKTFTASAASKRRHSTYLLDHTGKIAQGVGSLFRSSASRHDAMLD